MSLRVSLSLSTALLFFTASCSPPDTSVAMSNSEPSRVQAVSGSSLDEFEGEGLSLKLSDADGRPDTPALNRQTRGKELSAKATRALLDRLPDLEDKPKDRVEFALRPGSPPAPRPGETLPSSFPPKQDGSDRPELNEGPLKLLRASPQGSIDAPANLSLTFSHAMVALSSADAVEPSELPVTLSPQPPGTWRWLGTRTLLFQPERRFPMATRYEVEIPAGLSSAVGTKLEQEESFSFETPAPRLILEHPTAESQPLQPVIVLGFDQAVDPAALADWSLLRAKKDVWPVRLATESEIAADEAAKRAWESLRENRRVALIPGRPLPAESRIEVTIPAGAPSAEGPRTTGRASSFSFQTHGPLRLKEHSCGWRKRCMVGSPWNITFSNPLNIEDATEVLTIEPPLPEFTAAVYGSRLHVSGAATPRTTYKVTIDASLHDSFGQTLGIDQEVSFEVGDADAVLTTGAGTMVTLDPTGPAELPIYSRTVPAALVLIHAVTPEDWPAYLKYKRDKRPNARPRLPGKQVSTETITFKTPQELTETRIDLSKALVDGLGHALVVIEPTRLEARFSRPSIEVWVQRTSLGVDAFLDRQGLLTWTTALSDGASTAEAQLRLEPSGQEASSAADGLARFSLPTDSSKEPGYLVARKGKDSVLLPQSQWWRGNTWVARPPRTALTWHVLDDRGLYKPGETVRVKGWVRRLTRGPQGDVSLARDMPKRLTWELRDSRGNELANGRGELTSLNGFDVTLDLPADMNLGRASLVLRVADEEASPTSYTKRIRVEEFRRPEYEVSVTADPGPHVVGTELRATANASYFAGGGLAGSTVGWRASTSEAQFSPPGWPQFHFGRYQPWWWRGMSRQGQDKVTQAFEGTTDGQGDHSLRVALEAADPPLATTLELEATIQDVNRQAGSATQTLLVHPADRTVGLRVDTGFVERGKPMDVHFIVTDLDGKPASGSKLRVEASRTVWRQVKREWKEVHENPQVCEQTTGLKPATCTFKTDKGGRYRVRALAEDKSGRRSLSEMNVWVTGGDSPPKRGVEKETVLLIPDKESYEAGETARLLVQAPFFPAEGLLTLRREGLVSHRRFELSGATTVLEIPLSDQYVPNVHVHVDLLGRQTRSDANGRPDDTLPKRPAFASGSLNLRIPPLKRSLKVEAVPLQAELLPGAETEVTVQVANADGKAVPGAEVCLIVVDEAVLSIAGYELKDPLTTFHPERAHWVNDHHSRDSLLLADPEQLAPDNAAAQGYSEMESAGGGMHANKRMASRMAAAPMADAMSEPSAPPPIALRKDFAALAHFSPSLNTDREGRASVNVKLPDSLTRYRIMAIALSGDAHAGIGEANVTARLPIMARPSPPRFLSYGDRVQLPVVVHNQTEEPRRVDIAVRASNLDMGDDTGRRVEVPAGDRVEVLFPASTLEAGTASVQVVITSGNFADASLRSFPVWTPATTDATATYGVLDEGAVHQPLSLPGDAVSAFGGLNISTSSTALQGLSDAVLYLADYPFDCGEQLASRILAIAALRDVLGAFQAEGLPEPSALIAAVERDLAVLAKRQNGDGGFSLWRRGDDSLPYVSVHVALALTVAKEKGFVIPEELWNRSLKYLQSIESHFPKHYGAEARRTSLAAALHVRHRRGDSDGARARKLVSEGGFDGLSLEAVGWLLPTLGEDDKSAALLKDLLRQLGNQVNQTASTAEFVTSTREDPETNHLILSSSRRTDAVLLDAILTLKPDDALAPALARGLLAHRVRGRWGSTQENSWVLLALDRYFREQEKETPDFEAFAYLGEGLAMKESFRGRENTRREVQVPMSYLRQQKQDLDLTLSKDGPGRLYYRLGLRYAPADLRLDAKDRGFAVERHYEGVDDEADVWRDADGTWHAKPGARVRVVLRFVASGRRFHVALVDPLPAGLEALSLEQDASVWKDTRHVVRWPGGSPWRGQWYEHHNLRDERVEAFSTSLQGGVYSLSYLARATTPGRFVAAPARAEEMYSPETYGRSSTDILEIAARAGVH